MSGPIHNPQFPQNMLNMGVLLELFGINCAWRQSCLHLPHHLPQPFNPIADMFPVGACYREVLFPWTTNSPWKRPVVSLPFLLFLSQKVYNALAEPLVVF